LNLENFLIVGAIIFSIGLYGALTKRNAVAVLMCLELMFNGVNITAVAFSRYTLPFAVADASKGFVEAVLTGQIFAVFIITVAAAEVALGLAIVIAVYRSRETVLVTDLNRLRK
tara:strand:+ start:2874 stop:3215 length:342 start_codon:yes stop_codon:yes gene_type:complete